MKLISMVDFTLEQSEITITSNPEVLEHVILQKIVKYANFLKRPLKLGMFVPCDEDGNMLEEPDFHEERLKTSTYNKYQQAKERVLFEGFEVKVNWEKSRVLRRSGSMQVYSYIDENLRWWFPRGAENIEGIIPLELELTPTALKQIGL